MNDAPCFARNLEQQLGIMRSQPDFTEKDYQSFMNGVYWLGWLISVSLQTKNLGLLDQTYEDIQKEALKTLQPFATTSQKLN